MCEDEQTKCLLQIDQLTQVIARLYSRLLRAYDVCLDWKVYVEAYKEGMSFGSSAYLPPLLFIPPLFPLALFSPLILFLKRVFCGMLTNCQQRGFGEEALVSLADFWCESDRVQVFDYFTKEMKQVVMQECYNERLFYQAGTVSSERERVFKIAEFGGYLDAFIELCVCIQSFEQLLPDDEICLRLISQMEDSPSMQRAIDRRELSMRLDALSRIAFSGRQLVLDKLPEAAQSSLYSLLDDYLYLRELSQEQIKQYIETVFIKQYREKICGEADEQPALIQRLRERLEKVDIVYNALISSSPEKYPFFIKEIIEQIGHIQKNIQQELDRISKDAVKTKTKVGVEDRRAVQPTDEQGATKEAAKQLSKAQLWQTIDATLQQAEENKMYLLGEIPELRELRRMALQAFLTENVGFRQIGKKIGLTGGGARGAVQRGLELVFSSLPEEITREYKLADDLYKQFVQNDIRQHRSQGAKEGWERSKRLRSERKPRGKDIQPRKPRKSETQSRKKSETLSKSRSEANTKRWKRYREEDKPQGKPAFSEQGLENIRAGKSRQKEARQTTPMQEQTVVDFIHLQSQPQRKTQE